MPGFPLVGKEIDSQALSQYLSLRYVPAPRTIYRDVRSLPPGHLLIWNEHGIEIKRWYRLPMETKWQDCDEEEVVAELDALLRDSVRLRMRSDVRFGAYLSGGIDSSVVVAIMSECSPQPIKTFEERIKLTTTAFPPRHYIYAKKNGPGDVFRQFAERARSEPGWTCHEIDASHNPHITCPDMLMKLLTQIMAA